MTPADQYRTRAAQLRAMARDVASPLLRREWEHLARCYVLLAEQADKNGQTDTLYEPRPPRLGRGDAPQQ